MEKLADGIYKKTRETEQPPAVRPARQQLLDKLVKETECGGDAARYLGKFLEKKYSSEGERVAKLEQILEFAHSAKPKAAADYFDAMGITIGTSMHSGGTKEMHQKIERNLFRAFEALTDERVLKTRMTDFIESGEKEHPLAQMEGGGRSIGGGAYYYYRAIAETGAAGLFTSEKVLSFLKEIGPELAATYFDAIMRAAGRWEDNAGMAAVMTDERLFRKEAVEFIKSIDEHDVSLAYYYLKTICETGAVAELTDARVLRNARFVEFMRAGTAGGWFRAVGETKAVAELTDERVLKTADFANSMGVERKPWENTAAYNYYYAIGKTGAVAALTDERVLKTANFAIPIESSESTEPIGYFMAIGRTGAVAELTGKRLQQILYDADVIGVRAFFRAVVQTGAVGKLTSDGVLRFAESAESLTLKYYFSAIANTKAVDELTSERILAFASSFGKNSYGASHYFEAIGRRGRVAELTSEKVLSYAERLGAEVAAEYFRMIVFTEGFSALLDDRVLATADFDREMGRSAAAQHFYAIGKMGAIGELTSERVFTFAKLLGAERAANYFLAIGDTGAVAELTDDRVLARRDYLASKAPDETLEYMRALGATKLVAEFTSDSCIGYLAEMGGVGAQFLNQLYGEGEEEAAPPASAKFLIDFWAHSPDAMRKVIDRSPELLIYHGGLAGLGYDASDETAFLIKKGSKAEITRLALAIQDGIGSLGEYREPFGFVAQLKGMGFRPEERIKAIDRLVVSAPLIGSLPEELKNEMTGALSRTLSPDLAVPEEALRKAYPEIFEYLDRHMAFAEANPAYEPPIRMESVLELLSACHSLGREKLTIDAVKKEKQQASVGRKIEIKAKYENVFLTELRTATTRASYDSFIDAIDAQRLILGYICGEKPPRDKAISPELGNVLQGYFLVKHNSGLLADLIKIYYMQGPEAAKEWISGLEGNRQAVERMKGRGTNLEAVYEFRAEYKAVGAQSFQEKQEIRASQVYGELLSLIQELGYKNMKELGVEEGMDKTANAITAAKRLNELTREGKFSPEQKMIVDDVNEHVDNLKSAVGQLHAVEADANIVFFVPSDPVKKLQMGVGFPSCLDIRNGCNSFGAVARTIDANNVTLYAAEKDENGPVIGRVSLIECEKGFFVNSHFYENTNRDLFAPGSGWVDALVKLSEATGRDLMIVPSMYAPHERIEEMLGKAGFVLEKGVTVHVDRAACGSIYSDLGFSGEIPEEGKDAEFDAYVLKAKKK